MTSECLAQHEKWFRRYVAGVKEQETEDTKPLEVKLEHTLHVLANARSIVHDEAFAPRVAEACLLAALYHDLGRFEQYLRYRTFKDRESVNHGRLGVRLIKKTGCLEGMEKGLRHTVMAAVGLHNAYRLPPHLSPDLDTVVRVVRDSDKLDILRVIDEHLSSMTTYSPTVVLHLPDDPGLVSRKVIDCALRDELASYSDLTSVNDFRILLGMWIEDMNFPSSRQSFIAQGHARRILQGLPENGPCAMVRSYLLGKLSL